MLQEVRDYSIGIGLIQNVSHFTYIKQCSGYSQELVLVEHGKVLKTYNPEEKAGLFLSFIRLAEDKEDCLPVLTFVKKYGLLGEPAQSNVVLNPPEPLQVRDDLYNSKEAAELRYKLQQIPMETIAVWKSEIQQLRYAYDLYDLIEKRIAKEIRDKYIEWHETSVWFRESEGAPKNRIISIQIIHERIPFDDLDRNDTLKTAKLALPLIINDKLNGLVSAYVKQDMSHNGYSLSYSPNCLLGSLWLQFAYAVTGVKIYRACRVCGKSFEISSDGFTLARQYCSDACRFKHSNMVKAERKKTRKMQ